jgi:aminopeptidase N
MWQALLPLLLLDPVPLLSPDGRGRAAPDRAFDLLELGLDLDLAPETRSVSGTATFSLKRLGPGPLVLDQEGLRIEAVTAQGQPAPFRIEPHHLVVEVPKDENLRVTVRYAATPRTGLHFRQVQAPDRYPEIWSQGEADDHRHWFPSWDHPNDRFAYQGQIRGPAGWKVTTNSGPDLVNYLVMVAAAPYVDADHPANPAYDVWVPPGTRPEAIARVLEPIPAMMELFAARTGVAYPWGPYRQVFVQRFLYGGMENTGATIMDDSLLVEASVGSTRARRVSNIVAHELAHQWYGDLLTCRTWRELWLNEGFATFMAAEWERSDEGEARYADQVRRWYEASQSGPALAGRFHQGPAAPDSHNVYNKGASLLQMARVMLGEAVFWAGIQRYTRAHQHQLVDTIDLQRALEAESGHQLDWFFQQWAELPYVPKLTVTSRYTDEILKITVAQATGAERPRYTLPITVEVGTAKGPQRLTAWLEDDDVELSLPLGEAPTYIAFDPDGGVLSSLTHEQRPPAWAAQTQSPSPYARLIAIAALGETDQPDALIAILGDGARPAVEREAAAEALGRQRNEAALLAQIGVSDDRVRRAVARALGRCPSAAAAAALARLVERDPNPDVGAAAMDALADVDVVVAQRAARSALRRSGAMEAELRRAAIEALGRWGEVADLPDLLNPKASGRLRITGARAAADIASRVESPAARRRAQDAIARFCEPLLDDLDLRTRQGAIDVLGRVGDLRSVAALEAFRRADTVQETRLAAARSIEAIGAMRPATPLAPAAEDARLQRIEDELKEIRQTVERGVDRH